MKWQPTPVFLPGEFLGQRSLAGYSPGGQERVRHDLSTKQQQQKMEEEAGIPSWWGFGFGFWFSEKGWRMFKFMLMYIIEWDVRESIERHMDKNFLNQNPF